MSESAARPMMAIPEAIAFTDRASTYAESSSSYSPSMPLSASSQATTVTSGSRASRASLQRPQEAAVLNEINLRALNPIETDDDTPLDKGWPRLAHKMAEVPEIESFRRFRELNIKNLLYYQAEIADMEADLRKIENEDSRNTESKEQVYSRHAISMLGSMPSLEAATCRDTSVWKMPTHQRQCKLVLDIRQSLEKYNNALLQYGEISKMPDPDPHGVQTLRRWIMRRGCGPDRITGEGAEAWGYTGEEEKPTDSPWKRILPVLGRLFWPRKVALPEERDLVAAQRPLELDVLARWVKQDVTPLWHDFKHRKQVADVLDPNYNRLVRYSVPKILRATSLLTTIIACLLPIGAIAVLTTAKTTRDKLLYIFGFTMAFVFGLVTLTDAGISRVQIFVATAAFSAVLVVFVQNQ